MWSLELTFLPSPHFDLPFGKSWNASHNYTDGLNVTEWVHQNIKSIEILRTIEFPFAYSNGELVYPNKMRAFGHGMARAIKAYIEGEVLVTPEMWAKECEN